MGDLKTGESGDSCNYQGNKKKKKLQGSQIKRLEGLELKSNTSSICLHHSEIKVKFRDA